MKVNEKKSKDQKKGMQCCFYILFLYRERDIKGGAARRTARK